MINALGWLAAGILVLTISYQSFQQWQARNTQGVSVWLFIGQLAANTLFAIYAGITGDIVFLVANVLLFIASAFGLTIKLLHRSDPEATD